ncbi:lantibiotic dehydratase [Kitasatospora sp. HPMI-4]|uniref:lantibiotic dehydratase n=1 Tax=Kitasatospora sp. HPMI-4 TaxID=3448443 RepID=UPI003F1D87BA
MTAPRRPAWPETDERSHLLPLAGSDWAVWRDVVLRGAGFPVTEARRLSAPGLAQAAGLPDQEFDELWKAELERLANSLREVAADPRFREAVAWQNPAAVRSAVDKVGRPAEPGRTTELKHLQLVANYLQRYTVKNDTIGFFGPAAWGRLTESDRPMDCAGGPGLLAERTVYFENWAIDTLARRLSDQPGMRPWLRPVLSGGVFVDDDRLLRPYREPVELPPGVLSLLRMCDGSRTLAELAARRDTSTVDSIVEELRPWLDDGVVRMDLSGPIETHPERTLRERLALVGDREPRERALAALDELERGRDAVAAAAGRPDQLMAATAALDEAFLRITGSDAVRRHGEMYAGRTLVYEDTRRDVGLEIGRPVQAAIGGPLGLVADSARWFADRAGRNYLDLFGSLLDRHSRATGRDRLPLSQLLGMATRQLTARGGPPEPVADAVSRLQAKWARILELPHGVRRHEPTVESIRDAVRREFPATAPLWSAARHHSPDLMIAAAGLDAVRLGRFTAVMGELHLATNTLEARPFVERHADVGRLLEAAERDHAGRRWYSVPSKDSPLVNSRSYPAALLSPHFRYWCLHDSDTGAPGPVFPSAALEVCREDGRLVVVSKTGEGPWDLLEVLAEQVSAAIVGAFRPLAPARHLPRISIGRLVVQREAWSFEPAELEWAFAKTAARRFREAQKFREAHDMPVRTFCRVHTERKPTLTDFSSVLMLEQTARAVRRAAADTAERRSVTISEMLPDLGQTWLTDAAGAPYTAELRMVLVDPLGSEGARL